jgi:hypothetical protein
MTAADWSNVVSVRISVLAVGDPAGAAPATQTVLFRTDPTQTNQTNLVPSPIADAHLRLRQAFTATAALRDRLP